MHAKVLTPRLDWRRIHPGREYVSLLRRYNPQRWPTDEEVEKAILSVPTHHAALFFGVPFVNVATTSTAKSVAGFQAASNQAVRMFGFNIGFDGTTSTQGPALVEILSSTFGANPPGTASTAVTPKPYDTGRPETIQTIAAKTWTTEPTTLSLIESFFITVYMGTAIVYIPLTSPFIAKGSYGAVMRVTQQSGVTANCTGTIKLEE